VLAVRVPIRAFVHVHVHGATAEVVVLVVGVRRGDLAQGTRHVAEEKGLVLVDPDRGGCVAGEDGDLPEGNAGFSDDSVDLVGDVVEVRRTGRLDLERFAGYKSGRFIAC
jgi:hypothetical protein